MHACRQVFVQHTPANGPLFLLWAFISVYQACCAHAPDKCFMKPAWVSKHTKLCMFSTSPVDMSIFYSLARIQVCLASTDLEERLGKHLGKHLDWYSEKHLNTHLSMHCASACASRWCDMAILECMQVPTVASSMLLRSFNAIRTKSYGVAAYKGPDRSSLVIGRFTPFLCLSRARSQVSTPFRVTLGTPVSCAQQCIQHVRSRT
eukprot:scaffold2020_cov21-Tisochrysis_lutea.AAC.3